MLSTKKKRQLARESNTATLAAHLLYWSTLYAIKTHGQHSKEFADWLDSLEKGHRVMPEIEEEYMAESFQRKQRKYWRETVALDSAINWSANLKIIKKKLEYNIGYWILALCSAACWLAGRCQSNEDCHKSHKNGNKRLARYKRQAHKLTNSP